MSWRSNVTWIFIFWNPEWSRAFAFEIATGILHLFLSLTLWMAPMKHLFSNAKQSIEKNYSISTPAAEVKTCFFETKSTPLSAPILSLRFYIVFFFFVSNRFAEVTLVMLLKKKIKKTSLYAGWHWGIPLLLCLSFLKYFPPSPLFFLQNAFRRGDVKCVREDSWHPWSWHSVFWCGVSRTKVAISCSVAMHVPSRSRLKTVLSNKAPRHCIFLY